MVCNLDYIPSHLHTNDKPIIDTFFIGEELYYRCKPENLKKPYDIISLYDISHNRNFNEDIVKSESVYFNILENVPIEKYTELNHVTLLISQLSNNTTFYKKISKKNNQEIDFVVEITLKHDPVPCMYPHSVFEIRLNNEVICKENYNSTLNLKKGENKKILSDLRSEIRQELTSIIQSGLINDSEEIEIITEP